MLRRYFRLEKRFSQTEKTHFYVVMSTRSNKDSSAKTLESVQKHITL